MAAATSAASPAWTTLNTKEYVAHKRKVHSVAWSCGGQKLASGSVDQSVRVWSLHETGSATHIELTGHQDSVDQLRWDPLNPEVLGTASGDRTVRIWDTRTNKQVHAIEMRKCKALKNIKFQSEVNEMAWEPMSGGKFFFLTTGSGSVEIFRYADMLAQEQAQPIHSLQAHTANCYCIDFSPKGEYLAVGGADAMVTIWDVQELVCLRTCTRFEWPVRTLSFSCDSRFLASGSEDLYVDIADVSTGEQVHKLSCSAAMNSVAWHPSRLLLAYAADDKDRVGRDDGSLRIFGFPSA